MKNTSNVEYAEIDEKNVTTLQTPGHGCGESKMKCDALEEHDALCTSMCAGDVLASELLSTACASLPAGVATLSGILVDRGLAFLTPSPAATARRRAHKHPCLSWQTRRWRERAVS